MLGYLANWPSALVVMEVVVWVYLRQYNLQYSAYVLLACHFALRCPFEACWFNIIL